ncbi:30S ribosomal protein S16 [Limnochorda pilosa]|uniref:Small ribosomal subunit protein bS16 n=1 Tax=Limnochorda pilosa TaxID=1555112 RepID=A0A0K2SK50_LIMPI|nr:30S ribosomal protein S16 [Limnochorda pilosa]BAS27475.1 30S ribosomal protein S16 [Limnochorda pilosa]
MAVRIRLKRMGARHQPYYRLVVADSRAARDGRFIESFGTYNPISDSSEIQVDEEKALLWLGRGALPSESARRILERAGVWEKFESARRQKEA